MYCCYEYLPLQKFALANERSFYPYQLGLPRQSIREDRRINDKAYAVKMVILSAEIRIVRIPVLSAYRATAGTDMMARQAIASCWRGKHG